MHIQEADLLFCKQRKVLALFDRDLFVYVEYAWVIEVHLNVFEWEYSFHRHEKWNTSLDWEILMGLWDRILHQKLVELTDLFAAERQNIDQREKLVYVERVALA